MSNSPSYQKLIYRCLQEFVDSWNHHSLSTEHGMTPEQLYTLGMLDRIAENVHPTENTDFNSVDLTRRGMEQVMYQLHQNLMQYALF